MKHLLLFLISFLVWQIGFAQPGTNDAFFNTFDDCTYGDGVNNIVYSTQIQPDGKIILGGGFTYYNLTPNNRITRLNSDGTLDATFNIGTGFNDTVRSIKVQPDGKILIGGDFTSYNGTNSNRISRLNSNGTLDLSFSIGTGFNDTVRSIALQTDGKIIVGGDFTNYNGTLINRIVRLNSDGSLDNTFNIGSGFNGVVNAILIHSDGTILVGGDFTSYNSVNMNRIVRLNTDGTIDVNFDSGTGFDSFVKSITQQDDGKIVIGGNFSNYNSTFLNHITRLNEDGSIDLTFNIGSGFNGIVNTIALQADGKIFVGGSFSEYNGSIRNNVSRLNLDGSLDLNINLGTGFNFQVNSFSILPDNKVFIGGSFWVFNGNIKFYLIKINSVGDLDLTFNRGAGFNSIVNSLAQQSNGKVIAAGAFTSYNGLARNKIVRFNLDGTLDTTFYNENIINYDIDLIKIQSDDKIILVCNSYLNGAFVHNLYRLNADGSFDNTFNTGTTFEIDIVAVTVQLDGKIVFGGFCNGCNFSFINKLYRLNTDGSLDLSYDNGTGFAGSVGAIQIQNDNKILVGGNFNNYNGISVNNLIRLNEDGSLDTSFYNYSGITNISHIGFQSDGKLIINNGQILRLNPDGSMDPNFNNFFNSDISFIQNDDKIIVSKNGNINNKFYLFRLNPDGSIDNLFQSGELLGRITSIIQSGSDIYIGGRFFTYNNTCRHRIARINGAADLSLESVYVSPSDLDSCNGVAYFSTEVETNFNVNLGDGIDYTSNNGFLMIDSLCPGIYPFIIVDGNGDTIQSVFVVPTDSNYMELNLDTTILMNDTLTMSMENCLIDYNTIDTIYLASYQIMGGDTISLTFAIVDSIGINYVSDTLVIPNGNYEIQLQLYCLDKAAGKSFVYTLGLQRNGSGLSTLDVTELSDNKFMLYPNPTTDKVSIRMSNTKADLTIYDINGKKIMEAVTLNGTEINVSKLEPGIYLFEFIAEGKRTIKRVIKN